MKKPNDFKNHDEWLSFVDATVPPENVPFALAQGRTALYREFYELRGIPFPERFASAIDNLAEVPGPERTTALQALNERIFGDMIQLLLTVSAGVEDKQGSSYPIHPREVIEQLLRHLNANDAYFALWTHYKTQTAGTTGMPEWREYVVNTVHMTEETEIEFALLISELGRLLELYYTRETQLPKHFYFQIWFLHRTQGVERNPMLRALVQELLDGVDPCASA